MATRRRMDKQPRGHFLLAGDSSDLAAVRGIVERLPSDAYGQVFVEVASAVQIERWEAPSSMTVTWLCRDAAIGARGAVAPRGHLVSRAVSAWVEEWVPERAGELPFVMWIGCSASEPVDALYAELASRFEGADLHLHHPHGE